MQQPDFPRARPADVKLSARRLTSLLEQIDLDRLDMRSLVVVRDGSLVLERYRHDIDRGWSHPVYSVTKSVVVTLIGCLMYGGKLSALDLPVSALMRKPANTRSLEWEKTRRFTLRNLLTMTSGLDRSYNSSDDPIYPPTADRLALALAPGFASEAGARFNYSNGDATLVGAAVASLSGQDLLRTAEDLLFRPLAMHEIAWPGRDIRGAYPAGWALRMRPIDAAKIGQLYLNKGVWQGRRLFAAQFVTDVARAGVNPNYGLFWWRDTESTRPDDLCFYAAGWKSQRILVFPALQIVAVYTACLPDSRNESVHRQVVTAIRESVREYAKSEPPGKRLEALEKQGFRGVNEGCADIEDTLVRPG